MKYHIFIGSTLDDLKNERRELLRIVTELGHVPVIADYLDNSARNTPALLRKMIEECDYFIALVAHKYCAKDGNALPLIHECRIAANSGVPVLALIIDEKARWKPVKKEKDASFIGKLDDFKATLRGGPFETWCNTPDLCQKTQYLLLQEFCINNRSGWVKKDKTIEPGVANELSRLSIENSILRRQYCSEDREIDVRFHDELTRTLKMIALNKVSLSFYYTTGDNWENTRQFRLVRIFKLLVPEISPGKTTAEISRFLGAVLNPDLQKMVRKDYPIPSNTVKKIMADFSLLKLVRHVNNEEVKAGNEVWEITELGKELFSLYRLRQLEKVLAKKTEDI
ncbi:MAG: DUF4062 domain-containing protein [Treponema sp.]|nr:DUF4062 domain-containing protein [Treponema sp.]